MRGGRSVTDVLVDIASSVQDILRSEIRLAQSEVREQLIRVRAAGLLVAVGLGGGVLSGFFVLLAVFSTLRLLMPPWAAALCIAAAVAVIATVALRAGLRRLERVRPALKTVESPKETMEWPGPPQTK
jgi:putative superfamily III holin-X